MNYSRADELEMTTSIHTITIAGSGLSTNRDSTAVSIVEDLLIALSRVGDWQCTVRFDDGDGTRGALLLERRLTPDPPSR